MHKDRLRPESPVVAIVNESEVGAGGELHQRGAEEGRFRTNQGVIVSDDQNTLTISRADRSCWKTI